MTSPIMGGMPGDPYESKQDIGELNRQTLVGCVAKRGSAWHRRDDLMGDESNHYDGHIPTSDVVRRLFNWQPQRTKVAYLVPVEPQAGPGVVDIRGEFFRVVESQEDRHGILRDDNDYDLGVFKSGAMHPPYQVTLMEEAERLVGTQLGISAAGCLAKGARAWVEFSMEESLHDGKSGLVYRPNLVHADSMDGSIAYTKMLTVNATVCMNTLRWNLLEASREGRIVRRKHTSGIVGGKLNDERDALGILERVDETFLADLHKLIEMPVNAKQRIEVLDVIVPLTDDMTPRSRVLASNKRDKIMEMGSDPMVEPWIGTAWGEVQRYSTFQHWQSTAKGTTQWERNAWRDIMGKSAESDTQVVQALEKVLA